MGSTGEIRLAVEAVVAGIVIQHFIEQGANSVIIHHSSRDRLTPA
ncbi:hypothetical protein [Scytonema millei]|nr:hypothetical protein [Scytonema millei]